MSKKMMFFFSYMIALILVVVGNETANTIAICLMIYSVSVLLSDKY